MTKKERRVTPANTVVWECEGGGSNRFQARPEIEATMELATLIAENDGSQWPGRETDHWHRLAIHGLTGPREKYLVSIRFYPHPSKEPFQRARAVDDPA